MLWIFIFVISAFISSGSGDSSYASSFMHGQKPILRMGLDDEDDDAEHKELLKVPNWVSNLRYAIDEQVNKLGLTNAGAKIKQIVSDVADDVKDIGLQGNDEPDALEYSEKKGLRTLAAADEHRNPNKAEITGDPLWMVDLKSYVKDLISTKGRDDLEGFVRPVIDSVEKNNHIKIKDIDVNPYGELVVPPLIVKSDLAELPKSTFTEHRLLPVTTLTFYPGEIYINYEYLQKPKKSNPTKSIHPEPHLQSYRRHKYMTTYDYI